MPTPAQDLEHRIAAVRRFSRFYTRQLGLLQESLVETRFSLAQARVLYELAHRDKVTGYIQGGVKAGAIAIVQKLVPSWRDLPIRLAEMGSYSPPVHQAGSSSSSCARRASR